MSAPIWINGSITRRMGRCERDSSPTSLEEKGWPDKTPQSRRIVVPELPQSKSLGDLMRRRSEREYLAPSGLISGATRIRFLEASIGTPSCLKQLRVERQSPE